MISLLQMRDLWFGNVTVRGHSLGDKVWKWQNWAWESCVLTPKSIFPLECHACSHLVFVFSQLSNQLANQLMNDFPPK